MSRVEKLLLVLSTLAVVASGILYAAMKYLMTGDDPYSNVHHPLQPLVLKIHVLGAPLLVFAVGLVFTRHIAARWRPWPAPGKTSGGVAWIALVPLAASGYLIQTSTDATWIRWLVATHLVTAAAFVAGFGVHWVRRRVAAQPPPASPSSGAIEPSASSTNAM